MIQSAFESVMLGSATRVGRLFVEHCRPDQRLRLFEITLKECVRRSSLSNGARCALQEAVHWGAPREVLHRAIISRRKPAVMDLLLENEANPSAMAEECLSNASPDDVKFVQTLRSSGWGTADWDPKMFEKAALLREGKRK